MLVGAIVEGFSTLVVEQTSVLVVPESTLYTCESSLGGALFLAAQENRILAALDDVRLTSSTLDPDSESDAGAVALAALWRGFRLEVVLRSSISFRRSLSCLVRHRSILWPLKPQ